MRHKFLVLSVVKWLKSVYIYVSCRKIKTGVPLFGPLCSYVEIFSLNCLSLNYLSAIVSFHFVINDIAIQFCLLIRPSVCLTGPYYTKRMSIEQFSEVFNFSLGCM